MTKDTGTASFPKLPVVLDETGEYTNVLPQYPANVVRVQLGQSMSAEITEYIGVQVGRSLSARFVPIKWALDILRYRISYSNAYDYWFYWDVNGFKMIVVILSKANEDWSEPHVKVLVAGLNSHTKEFVLEPLQQVYALTHGDAMLDCGKLI